MYTSKLTHALMKNILYFILATIYGIYCSVLGLVVATFDSHQYIVPAEINWKSHDVYNYSEYLLASTTVTSSFAKASWYDYQIDGVTISKYNPTAASRIYPKGTKLRVSLPDPPDNPRFVDVLVNDYGPESDTCRDIDLSSFAFEKLSPLSVGVVDVIVEPLYIPDFKN